MRRLIPLSLLLLAAAARADDPEGTTTLTIEVGKSAGVPAADGSHLLCDDLEVVAPEFSPEGGLRIRGLAPGTTLCGVRSAAELPSGLYRVTVVPASAPAKGGSKKSEDTADAGTEAVSDAVSDAGSEPPAQEPSAAPDAGSSY
jgi:hypothetical protein